MTVEKFTCVVESNDYQEADARAWDTLAKYLGKGISRDLSANWELADITHGEHPEKPDTLVSSATFKRTGDEKPDLSGDVALLDSRDEDA